MTSTIPLWLVVFAIGLVVAAMASRRAVDAALMASDATNISPGLIGLTVMAVGTDLPEIANSIISSLTGHGDVNVGDSAGSAMTQVTLVLAVLCFTTTIRSQRRAIGVVGLMTVVALIGVALVVRDEVFSRTDGLLLIGFWIASLFVVRRFSEDDPERTTTSGTNALLQATKALGWLVIVAAAATAVVQSFIRITEAAGVPELVASAIVLALGTSLPELIVDLTAIRRGAVALALGDLFGSSLLDATLAVGSGPALRATVVSSEAVIICVIAALGVLASTAVMVSRKEHRYVSATLLLTVYLVASGALILFTA